MSFGVICYVAVATAVELMINTAPDLQRGARSPSATSSVSPQNRHRLIQRGPESPLKQLPWPEGCRALALRRGREPRSGPVKGGCRDGHPEDRRDLASSQEGKVGCGCLRKGCHPGV